MLSVVLPAYNEAQTIKGVVMDYYREIVTKIPSKLVLAEDGSFDHTQEILDSLAKEIPIALLSEHDRKGYAKSVHDALRKCNENWVFFSDSDGQYAPSDFWRLWENRGRYDMIIGRKVHRNEDIYRIVLSKGFHVLVNSLFGLSLHDGDCGFRLIRKNLMRSVLDETRILKYSFWTEFTIRASLKGFNICEVPISHANRTSGRTRIYAPSKIPLIIIKQMRGLADLYKEMQKRHKKCRLSLSQVLSTSLRRGFRFQRHTRERSKRGVA